MTPQRDAAEVFAGHDAAAYRYERVPDDEFAARHRAIRGFCDAEGLDAVLIAGGAGTWDRNWTNTRWAVNHVGAQLTNYSYVVFPRHGDPAVLAFPIVAWLPARRAREVVADVRASTDPAVDAVARLRELDLHRGRVGIVETDLYTSIPHAHHERFTTALPDVDWRTVTREWWRALRLVRSDTEIAFLERAAHIGDAMTAALAERVAPGQAERDIFAVLSDAMIRAGGEIPAMVLAASGPMGVTFDTFQRERHLDRVLEHGDVVLTELAPRFPDGSECQIGRTYCLGAPTPPYAELLEVAAVAEQAVVDVLRPGRTDEDVADAAGVISDAGFDWLSPVVHGPEGGATGCLPHIASSVEQPEEQRVTLAPNMVLTVQIHVGTAGHAASVFLADTWVTTADTPRRLHHFPRGPMHVV